MAFQFKTGSKVRQVLPAPIVGTVEGFSLDQTTGDICALVKWTDADGEHSRYFTEAELAAAE